MAKKSLAPRRRSARERLLAAADELFYGRSEEHTSELQSQSNLVCRLLLEKKKHTTFHSSYFPTHASLDITLAGPRLILLPSSRLSITILRVSVCVVLDTRPRTELSVIVPT